MQLRDRAASGFIVPSDDRPPTRHIPETESHQVLHRAGRDLTAELAHAPHGAHLLDRVPVVGTLRES